MTVAKDRLTRRWGRKPDRVWGRKQSQERVLPAGTVSLTRTQLLGQLEPCPYQLPSVNLRLGDQLAQLGWHGSGCLSNGVRDTVRQACG